MKKGFLIGILAIVVIVIAGGCTQIRESTAPIEKNTYPTPVEEGEGEGGGGGGGGGNGTGGVTYQGVLDMFEKECIVTFSGLYNFSGTVSPVRVCEEFNNNYNESTTCVIAQRAQPPNHIVTCESGIFSDEDAYVFCCNPPQ